ncbi:MAG: PAS domain S-box protein [Methanoregula sp.]|jgi:PAS domain S-box-containing protein|uniref:PAS domain S-box protein n=1 Tax=Methanoregula sp. TaxID=2052170 RepID=UPI003C2011F9
MKQLDQLWTELQPLLTNLSPEEQEKLNTAFDRVRKGSSLLESKYHHAIHDRAAVHSQLEKSSEDLLQRSQTLFENSGTAMVVIENDGTISLANTLFLDLFGYPREEVENRINFFVIFDERFRDQVRDYHRRRRTGDVTVPHRYEAQVISSEGKTLDVIIMVGLFLGTNQSVVSIIDITDQKRMEDELRLFKISADRAYDEIFWLDFEGNLLYVNDAAARKTGYSREELLAMKVFALDPDFSMEVWQGFIKDLRKKGSMIFETRHRLKNGKIMEIEIATNYVKKDDHEYSFAFVRDITDHKRTERDLLQTNTELHAAYGQLAATEQELREQLDKLASSQKLLQESETKFHSVFNNANDAIFMHLQEDGAPGRFLEVNDFMCTALGYTREELLAMTVKDILSEVHMKEISKISRTIAERGFNTFYAEFRRKDGSAFPVEVNSRKYSSSGQEIILAVARDVSEWKHTEEEILRSNKALNTAYEQLAAVEQELRTNYENLRVTENKLRESEAWSREFTELLPQFVYEIDTAGRLIFVNKYATEVFGITPEMLDSGLDMRDFIIPEEWEKVQKNLALIAKSNTTGIPTTHGEYHCRRRDGTLMPTNIYTAPVYRDGKLTGFRGIVVDTTEASSTQEALQKSETRFRELAELLPQIVFEVDENLKFTFFNWNTIEMTGYAYDDLSQNRTGIFDMMREADHQSAERFFTRILKDRETGHMECVIITQDGKEIPAILSASPIISENRIAGIRGVIVDITEQKSLEQALRESELRFRELAELVPQFIFETDRNFRFTYLNLGALTIAGYSNDDITQGLDALSLVDITDRPQIRDTFTRILNGEVVPPLQFPLNKKDREKLPVLMYATPIVRDNNYAGIRGIIVDIADQKRLETALATTNKKLNMMNNLTRHDVLNNITGLIGLVDMLGEMTPDSKILVLVSEIRNLIIKIKDQIIFTRDYQLVGVKAPQWESLCKEVRNAASVIGLNAVRLNLPESDKEIYADPLFGRVFYNLIDNSFRHGGSVRSISIETEVLPEGSLLVRYCDDGIGIPPDEKNLIFEQGYGKNTGFGLFIIREILGITGLTIQENGIFRSGVQFEITVPKGAWRPASDEKSPELDPKKDKGLNG